jgi:hypothetical protein
VGVDPLEFLFWREKRFMAEQRKCGGFSPGTS